MTYPSNPSVSSLKWSKNRFGFTKWRRKQEIKKKIRKPDKGRIFKQHPLSCLGVFLNYHSTTLKSTSKGRWKFWSSGWIRERMLEWRMNNSGRSSDRILPRKRRVQRRPTWQRLLLSPSPLRSLLGSAHRGNLSTIFPALIFLWFAHGLDGYSGGSPFGALVDWNLGFNSWVKLSWFWARWDCASLESINNYFDLKRLNLFLFFFFWLDLSNLFRDCSNWWYLDSWFIGKQKIGGRLGEFRATFDCCHFWSAQYAKMVDKI